MAVVKYHEITYWPNTGSNGFGGFTFGTPQLIEGRWEERSQRYQTPHGEEKTSRAIAYINLDVDVGDYLAVGDHTAESDPTVESLDAYRVEALHNMTDLRNMTTVRQVML